MKLQHILSLSLFVVSAAAMAQNVKYEYTPIADARAERVTTINGGLMDFITDDIVSITFEDKVDLGKYASYDEAEAQVQTLYHSRWYDCQRFLFNSMEILTGNLYSAYSSSNDFATDENVRNAVASLSCVVDQARLCLARLENPASQLTEAERKQLKGECLTMEALAYFYMVRMAGKGYINTDAADLFHSTWKLNSMDGRALSNRAELYDHVISLLNEAMICLDREAPLGRIGYYSAEGLLAKVYLNKASISGKLNAADLDQAAALAKDVIDNSGRQLLSDYSQNFQLRYNANSESLISFNWRADINRWTYQNSLQSDLGMIGFDDMRSTWGDFNGPSLALQEAFGVNLLDNSTDSWLKNPDTRLKATMMLPGFTYDYFWQDKGGFDYLKFLYEYSSNYGLSCSTGANCVKHLYGNTYDHEQGVGHPDGSMASSLATHVLRLSDIYLIYAEAKMGAARTTSTDASVIDAFYAVRHRADATYQRPSQVSWEDVWKERRLEFALEGDRWFDIVRVSSYDYDRCVSELLASRGQSFWSMDNVYQNYYRTGVWNPSSAEVSSAKTYNPDLLLTSDDDGVRYLALPLDPEIFMWGNASAMPQ